MDSRYMSGGNPGLTSSRTNLVGRISGMDNIELPSKEQQQPFDGSSRIVAGEDIQGGFGRKERPAWLELVQYLVFGLGMLFAVSVVIGIFLQEITLLIALLLFSINVFFLLGSVIVFGLLTGKLDPREMGLWPVRWKARWLLVVTAVTLGLLPVRVVLGTLALEKFGGGLDGLEMRMDIFIPGGLSLHGFLITLLFTGVLIPIAEEMYFRGAIFGWLRRSSLPLALVGSTLLFGIGHMDSVAVAVSSLVLGFANALLYEKTRSIWVPIAVHALNNTMAVMLIYASMLIVEQGLVPGL